MKENKGKAKGRFYQDVAFRSEKDDWETPYSLFEKINHLFDFDCDVCADQYNALCDNYFTKEFSCLANSWYNLNYMNPPYGRGMDKFIKKAYIEYIDFGKMTIALVPSRTDTKWFHNYIYNKAEIIFVKGRITFYTTDGRMPNAAPFPSMIVGWGVNKATFRELEEEINGNTK
jgi:phage N-6-adenine-methyltransferase